MYAADLPKSITREASLSTVAREAKYYQENIGKVTSVDDLLNNHRLFSYAMSAHGLDDMIYAKAFMRKVLESDLSDSNSFAAKLVDSRFLTFAKSFNFSPNGDVAVTEATAQDSVLESETIGLYSERRVRQGSQAATEAAYFQSAIGNVRNVNQLLADPRLFSYALKAYELDPNIASKTTIRDVLTSDLNDPASFANQLTDDRYRALAAAFSFASDGTVPEGQTAQSATQTIETVYLNYENTGLGSSPAAASFKSQYFTSRIADVISVDDILNDQKVFDFVLTAFGLDPPYESKENIRNILTSDLNDPDSFANQQERDVYRRLAAAFNFNTDGTLDDGVAAQTNAQRNATVDGYFANYDVKVSKSDKYSTDVYKIAMPKVSSVDALLGYNDLYKYVLAAFDLDPAVETKSKIRKVLQSDLSDPLSYANRLRDPRYVALAAAFNFDENGIAQVPRKAQTETALKSTIELYNAAVDDLKAENFDTKRENAYYTETIGKIKSLDEFLENKRLVEYVSKAFGFASGEIDDRKLRQILTSDLLDRDSFINRPENAEYRDLALAFNFTADGKLDLITHNQAQDREEIVRTMDLYVRQSMEQSAGSDNAGVRLALYFQRKASSLTSPYAILADAAIFEVVRTALSLPDTMSQADIDRQASMITKKIDIADFQDPKKVEKFLARFSALYDLKNSSGASSIALALFGNS
jgi:hypothetical protein